jgi:hypothetical protein
MTASTRAVSTPSVSTRSGSAASASARADPPEFVRPFVVRRAPVREPPFDDELAHRHLAVVGPDDRELPFDAWELSPVTMRPALGNSANLRVLPRPDLPDVSEFARRLVIGIVETAIGRRPAAQLAAHTAPAVYSGLTRDAGRIHRLGSAARPARLHSLHITEPADGVAEIVVVLRVGSRFRAMALRLEAGNRGWCCVRLQIG